MLTLLLLLTSTAPAQDTGTPPPVVGGHPADKGDWPDAAGIVFHNDYRSVDCTGVLVAPRVVLTAGHCVGGITHVILDAPDYSATDREIIKVQRTYEYPSSQGTVDIAALLLQQAAQTEPRLIARDCVLDDLYDGADVAIVGYGATDEWGTQYGTELMEAFSTVNDHDCSNISDGCNSSVSPGGEISAGGDGVDACYGDSGGPLYLMTDHGDYLVGITSRAYQWVTVPCSDGGIYGRPDYVLDWIEEKTGQTLPEVDCSSNTAPAPTAPPLQVRKNESGSVPIHPHDPDEGDRHAFEIIEAPEHGTLEIAGGGRATYTPDRGYTGADSALIEVSDDGEPSKSGQAELQIEVLTGREWRELTGEGCGCATGVAGGWPWLLGLALLGLRRRRG